MATMTGCRRAKETFPMDETATRGVGYRSPNGIDDASGQQTRARDPSQPPRARSNWGFPNASARGEVGKAPSRVSRGRRTRAVVDGRPQTPSWSVDMDGQWRRQGVIHTHTLVRERGTSTDARMQQPGPLVSSCNLRSGIVVAAAAHAQRRIAIAAMGIDGRRHRQNGFFRGHPWSYD